MSNFQGGRARRYCAAGELDKGWGVKIRDRRYWNGVLSGVGVGFFVALLLREQLKFHYPLLLIGGMGLIILGRILIRVLAGEKLLEEDATEHHPDEF